MRAHSMLHTYRGSCQQPVVNFPVSSLPSKPYPDQRAEPYKGQGQCYCDDNQAALVIGCNRERWRNDCRRHEEEVIRMMHHREALTESMRESDFRGQLKITTPLNFGRPLLTIHAVIPQPLQPKGLPDYSPSRSFLDYHIHGTRCLLGNTS